MELNGFLSGGLERTPDDPAMIIKTGDKFVFSKTFYQNSNLHYPMVYAVNQGNRQEKSFFQNIRLYEKASAQKLVTAQYQFIYINKITRKPVPIPDWSVTLNFPRSSERFRIHVAAKPDSCFTSRRKVQFSDYDKRNHVSSTSYIRWMIDAAAEAASKGTFSSFRKNLDHCAEVLEILYRKECHVGDNVCVYVWEEEPLCLCFHIAKQGETGLVSFGRIKFYKDLFKSKI